MSYEEFKSKITKLIAQYINENNIEKLHLKLNSDLFDKNLYYTIELIDIKE